MLRKLLLSTAMLAVAGSAYAADLPARVAAPAPYVAAPIFTWTGFYVGLNAGGSWNNKNHTWTSFGLDPNSTGSFSGNNNRGFTAGGQAGYNMQFGSFVAGVEADIDYIDRSNGGAATFVDTAGNTYVLTRGDSNKYFGTLRGRVGFAFDRALIYATGGLAFGGKNGGVTGVYTPSGGVSQAMVTTGGDGSNTGWTLGGGLEYAFANPWSVKLEYLHVDLGSHSKTVTVDGTNTGFTVDGDNKFDVVRAGVNYRF